MGSKMSSKMGNGNGGNGTEKSVCNNLGRKLF